MLFNEIMIKNLKLKNRIIMPAISLNYAPDGHINQRIIDFYTERACGGAGLIILGGAAIEESNSGGGLISIHSDEFIDGHSKVVKAVKDNGARVGLQLFHAGRYSFGFLLGKDVTAPSPVTSRLTGHKPREMNREDILRVIEYFGDAAVRARRAGYDLVEVIASAGYLISQFLSPVTNHRNDEYGGTLENRMRFGLQVIENIRTKAGGDFPLSVRLGGSDFIPGGVSAEEIDIFASELEKASVDLVNVTGGWHESYTPQIMSEVPRGAYAYLAARIKKKLNIPVAASNRINDSRMAEEILANHQADLVSIARGFLADPHWAEKTRWNDPRLRKCIACMSCLDRLFSGSDVLCAINPQCGKEKENAIKPAGDPNKVVIIGAGPAGLEAARVAGLKGHLVSLWETSDKIGGQWNLACAAPGKQEFASLLDYYTQALADLDVEINLNTTATVPMIRKIFPDAVILATGAQPYEPEMPVNGKPFIVNAHEVLNGTPVSGPDIVLIGGGSVGCETALFLAAKGTIDADTLKFLMLHEAEDIATLKALITRGSYRIHLIETGPHLAPDIGKSTRWALMKHLNLMGVNIYTGYKVTEINTDGIMAVNNNGAALELKADTVVMATGSKPVAALYQALKDYELKTFLVGDATGSGKVLNAIHQAFTVANSI